jgi:hypothetical protein
VFPLRCCGVGGVAGGDYEPFLVSEPFGISRSDAAAYILGGVSSVIRGALLGFGADGRCWVWGQHIPGDPAPRSSLLLGSLETVARRTPPPPRVRTQDGRAALFHRKPPPPWENP